MMRLGGPQVAQQTPAERLKRPYPDKLPPPLPPDVEAQEWTAEMNAAYSKALAAGVRKLMASGATLDDAWKRVYDLPEVMAERERILRERK